MQNPGLAPELADLATALRAGVLPLLHQLAGNPPRPVRLQQGIGLDKTLASRLVQAARADSDAGFLHALPSPTGLRIVLQRAEGHAEPALIDGLAQAVQRFEATLDRLPGGRQALHARIGDASRELRAKREQAARQASFKAVSFLFGHYADTVTTALFLLPSATPGRVDAIEVHRRIGLHRISAATALPLLSVHLDAGAGEGPAMTPLAAERPSPDPADYLLGDGARALLPQLQLQRDGGTTLFVLPPGSAPLPPRITTAWRVRRALPLLPDAPHAMVRNYMLHTPCQALVRDLYLAPGLWPDAWPDVGFFIPGPSGTPPVAVAPGEPHVRRLDLSVAIEQRRDGFALDTVPDQAAAIETALAAAGVSGLAWRGWRCAIAYPVPLVEMQFALRFAAHR